MTKSKSLPMMADKPQKKSMDTDLLEKLAMITCTKEEKKLISKDLEKIISYIESLEKVDTQGIAPMISVQKEMSKKSLREDEVNNALTRDALLENAPAHIGGMIQVPVVIDKNEK